MRSKQLLILSRNMKRVVANSVVPALLSVNQISALMLSQPIVFTRNHVVQSFFSSLSGITLQLNVLLF